MSETGRDRSQLGRIHWAVVPCLALTSSVTGGIVPYLHAFLMWGTPFVWWGTPVDFRFFCLVSLPCALHAAGSGCAVGLGLALCRKRAARAVVAVLGTCLSSSAVTFAYRYEWHVFRVPEVEPFFAAVLRWAVPLVTKICLAALLLAMTHDQALRLRARGRLGLIAPFGYILLGAGGGLCLSWFAGADQSTTHVAIGAFFGLTQYYALVVALAFHERRSAAPAPKDMRTSP